MTSPTTLPEGSLLLHLGPQKTGSTAIQLAMHQSRDRLAELGVHYPGPGIRPAEAGWAAMGIGSAVGRPPPRIALWEELVADVRATTLPRTCISDEDFARATPEAAGRITADLGADRVHLVFVARRLDKLLPSHWQERVKSRLRWSYPEFLRLMAAPNDGNWEWWMTWSPHDVATVIERWSQHVPRERITVIVADEQDHDLLPRSFASMLALPAGTLQAPTDQNNRSLTYAEAEAVRRVNQVFADNGWTSEQYWRIVQAGIVGVLKSAERTADVARGPGLPSDVLAVVNDRSDAQAEAIAAAGVNVVGDPDSLRTRDRVEPDDDPVAVDAVSMELFANVVQGAVVGALDLQKRELRRARRQRPAPGLDTVAARDLARALAGRVRGRLTR